MDAATFPDRVLEFFTLRDAEREMLRLPEGARVSLTRELKLAFQKREAAETLWPRGSTAEALKLARSGLEAARSSLGSFPVEGRPAWVDRAQAIAAEALQRAGDAPLPELESEVTPGHEETFRTMIDALVALDDSAGAKLATTKDIARVRRQRVTATLLGAAFAIALLAWWFHKPPFSKATATAQMAEYGGDFAIDGDVKTWWLLNPGTTGALDLVLTKPRSVKTLRVASCNPPYNDRGVKDAHIEAYLDNVLVKAVDVTFPEPVGADATWTDVDLGAPKSDRIRINAKSNHKTSGAIAEVEIK